MISINILFTYTDNQILLGGGCQKFKGEVSNRVHSATKQAAAGVWEQNC